MRYELDTSEESMFVMSRKKAITAESSSNINRRKEVDFRGLKFLSTHKDEN